MRQADCNSTGAQAKAHGYPYGTTERINAGLNYFFPPPQCHPGAKAIVANKWVIGFDVRFRTLWGLPNRAIFYQVLTKNVQRTGMKVQIRADKGGILRPIYLNRVESRGSCQPVMEVLIFQSRREPHGSGQAHGPNSMEDRSWVGILWGRNRFAVQQSSARLPLGDEGCRAALSGFVGRDESLRRPSC